MLRNLAIENIAVVERSTLLVDHGLTVLTGDTGAGKSVLFEALGLALGAKADRSLVRHGARCGEVVAVFELPSDHPARALLSTIDIPMEGDTLRVRRVLFADGGSRAYLNDRGCGIAVLRDVGELLVALHTQHHHVSMLDPGRHRDCLDSLLNEKAMSVVQARWQEWQLSRQAKEALEEEVRSALQDADYWRHASEELETLSPQLGEEEALAAERSRLMAAERVTAELTDALQDLADDELLQRLSSASGRLQRASSMVPEEARESILAAIAQLDEGVEQCSLAQQAVMGVSNDFQPNTEKLEAVEERLFSLRAAARKYSCEPDALVEVQARVAARLLAIDTGEEQLKGARANEAQAAQCYQAAAGRVSTARKRTAKMLERMVQQELNGLHLGSATFCVSVETEERLAGPGGMDRVTFLLAANPGEPAQPLAKVISGGELARLVLALQTVIAVRSGRRVLLFDEVDQGVGGAVANAVGERLERIAEEGQVLVITHSPQVAARGRCHWHVAKSVTDRASSHVSSLTATERVDEVARMMSGATITPAARAAAMDLLQHGAAAAKSAA